MTVIGCSRCAEVHGRMTSLSARGCIYFDSDLPTNYDGCFGCPQCARILCALCADELNGICLCGGELVHGAWYTYDGDNRLPDDIAACGTTDDRLLALDERRRSTGMIQAEYDHFKSLIAACEEARQPGEPLPVNNGLHLLRKFRTYYDRGALTARELVNVVWESCVEQNVDQMIDLLPEKSIEHVQSLVEHFPSTDDGWSELQRRYAEPAQYRENYIPQRSPSERIARDRKIVIVIRSALDRRSQKTM